MKANDISLYDLVGKRFNTLDRLKMAIEKISNMKVDMIAESQTERPEDSDDMIDFCYLELQDIHTMFYLKDNAGRYYITEVEF
ncbi:hypothetical protein [Coprococcus sp. AM11-30B]|uniref:hypothetical protein n=1 Tax=Coprococcus sp. AM11-30B TaxID=2997950 RepID=UPI0022DF20CF|nr:hypothetical protein [Coprococcus sp. AM11-30B]